MAEQFISRGFKGRARETDRALEGRIPPGQYETKEFPVLSAGPTPRRPLGRWDFSVYGEVAEELKWTWDEFLKLPRETFTADIHCVTKWSKLDTVWTGVSVDTLLEGVDLGAQPEVGYLIAFCDGGYTTNLPLADVRVSVGLRKACASHRPFGAPDLRTSFQPHRVAIETTEGQTVEESLRPRDSFAGHSLDTPWSRLQLAYFAGYAMWTYLNTPFLFAWDGVETEEVEPWRENGETWRRLKVTLPPDVASHSAVQTFYFNAEGLLQRHDYDVEVSGGTPAAHYVSRHEEFSGILVPTRRRVFGRREDGTPAPEPLVVSIDLSEVEFGYASDSTDERKAT